LFLFFQYGDPSTVFYDSSNGGDIQVVVNKMETAGGMTCLVLAKAKYTYSGKNLTLPKPIKICGQGIGETILDGFGLKITGSKSNGSVVIEDLSIQRGMGMGLYANSGGMDLIVRRCNVKKCGMGVSAQEAHISCDDVQVVGCTHSGVLAQYGGTVKLSGENTRIEGNVTSGDSGSYGLWARYSSSKIQIVTPLTKDTISINNGGGGNCGRSGTIEQISEQVSSGSAGESKSDLSTPVVNSPPPPYASTKVSLLGLSFKVSISLLLAKNDCGL